MDDPDRARAAGDAILFICKANVCRSPLMEAGLRQRLTTSRHGAGWSVESAGAATRRTAFMCQEAALVLSEAGWPGDEPPHRSRSIAEVDLAHKDLLLAASREERAQVARAAPSARQRTFTLLEALHLGDASLRPAELDRAVEMSEQAGTVRAYAEFLDSRRGIADALRSPKPWFRRPSTVDIRDVHQLGRRAHRVGLRHALQDTTLLAERLDAFADQLSARGDSPH